MGGRKKEGTIISRIRSQHQESPESYTASSSPLTLLTFQGWCWDRKMLSVADRCSAYTFSRLPPCPVSRHHGSYFTDEKTEACGSSLDQSPTEAQYQRQSPPRLCPIPAPQLLKHNPPPLSGCWLSPCV